MADTIQPSLQDCATCGALIDVSDEDPFALMHCPTCGAAMRVRRQFGSFDLQEVLGAGGMGAVYRALDVNLHRSVALKLLRREYSDHPEFIRQFAHEAAITAQINHPNVVKVYSCGEDGGLFYIAMELVDKGSLDDLMTIQGRISEIQVLDVGVQIAQGLNAALKQGLIHRDVKPGNILFADAHTAKIVDFGLAVPVDQAGTLGGEIWGTPYYVAPEKLDNKPEDLRSDIYSLGASLFHAIAGRPPYEAEDASVVALKHLKSQPVSLQTFAPDVSGATAYVINRTLHKDPDQRYQSYDELIQHLEYAKSELRAKAGKAPARQRVTVEDERSERAMSWVTIGMAAAFLLGGGALYAFKDQIFGPGKPLAATIAAQTTETATPSAKTPYDSAREQLIAGQYEQAASAFRNIEAQPNASEPIRSWAGFHAALAWTLAGKLDEARTDWQKLIDRGPFSSEPHDQNLAEFFIETARRASSNEPSPETVAQDYSKATYQSLALLALAAKNWALGAFDRAEPLFRQFSSALPEGGNAWVREYIPIAKGYLSDFTSYRSLVEQAKAATTPEQQKAVLPDLKTSLGNIKLKGGLETKAMALVQEIEQNVAAYEEETARKRAEQEGADAKILTATKAKATPLSAQYRFGDARVVFAGASVTSEKGKRDKDALMKRAEWLSEFKTQLIRDLAAGYAGPIQKRTGGQLTGVTRATDTHIEIKTPYGSIPVQWADITPDSIFTMARSFLRPDSPAQRLADRKWLLGVYAFFAGKITEGRALLTEASQLKQEYQNQMPLFLEAVENP